MARPAVRASLSAVAVTFVGTAGWSIPAAYRDRFPASGSQLEQYAARLPAVEINSSFYRPHQRKTYARWAASVPDDFRFSVKLPRTITQGRRLQNCDAELDRFLEEVTGLGKKLGVLLVQLPPSLLYDSDLAESFFRAIKRAGAPIACEPRHTTWFMDDAETLLARLNVMRVAADPPRAPTDGKPGGDTRFAYWRLHGSPRIYYSNYSEARLESLAHTLRSKDWCIFDNTAAFHALCNALWIIGR